MKHITYIFAFLLGLMAISAVSEAAQVTLKNTLTVEGDEITFGDVFHGAEEKTEYVIASSPAPGKNITFKASSLAFVARKHGLEWNPSRSIQRVTVIRRGQRIPEQQITEEIYAALETELQSDQFEMALTSRGLNIQVSVNELPIIEVESLSYSLRKETFSAILVAPADAENPRRYRVAGKIYQQVMVPVTAHLMRAGEEIREADIDYKMVRRGKVSRNVAIHIDDILGKSPRRTIRTGGLINLNNLGEPVTIPKGKIIAVTLKNGGIALSITGRALEDGAEGDVIRVENIASRKIVQAQIINAQEVRIISPQKRLAAIQ
ncbi:flagella basal body P-ring formation protein FlgA [Alphaproteobacteria bacterium 46_93_T64]|nr:flagella basal body P-ring formation protein FlgA [Alphaproteobacteria bacterium 46_93_T64]